MKNKGDFKLFIKQFFEDVSNILFHSSLTNEGEFGKVEKEISKIILNFLKFKKYDSKKVFEILKDIFDTYSEKIFYLNSYNQLKWVVKKNIKKEIDIDRSCKYISKLPAKYRLFILYNLMDIAAYDKLYSIEEEDFIDSVRKKINIHSKTFNAIKSSYTKKGLYEERKIIEEQNRKKLAESFLPYNAYKILGVSTTVTKAQLKKVYRTLAKKYHPDKYYGQSEEIIQKAEDKFQDITKAYEIIVKHKKF